MPSPALILPLPVNRIPYKLAPIILNKILRSLLFLTPFINKSNYSRRLIIQMISFISPFENMNIVVRKVKSKGRLNPNIFFWIAASVADKTFLANGFNKVFIKDKQDFCDDPRHLPEIPHDYPILSFW